MAEHGMAAGNGNELCGEEIMIKTMRGGGMRMTEHGMAAYPLSLNICLLLSYTNLLK
jgi:hypothetical protein